MAVGKTHCKNRHDNRWAKILSWNDGRDTKREREENIIKNIER